MSRIEAGQFLGEIGLLLGQARIADVRACGPALLLELAAEDLWLALDLFPGLYGDLRRTAEARRAGAAALAAAARVLAALAAAGSARAVSGGRRRGGTPRVRRVGPLWLRSCDACV